MERSKIIFNFQSSIFNIALLIFGSAFLLYSCKSSNSHNVDDILNPEAIVTQQSINHTLIQSLNGVLESKMTTPLMERHEMAREPFMEFPNGIEITRYDSIGNIESTLRANYAIYYEKREFWEARGNVVGHSVSEGRTLRTEQLFWDEKMRRIYSNVNSYVEQPDGIHFGQGFESDQEFHHWEFRHYRGRVNFDPDTLERNDTTSVQSVAPAVTPATVTPSTTPNTASSNATNKPAIVTPTTTSDTPTPSRPLRSNRNTLQHQRTDTENTDRIIDSEPLQLNRRNTTK